MKAEKYNEDKWESTYRQSVENLSSEDVADIKKFIEKLKKIRKTIFAREQDEALNPSHWNSLAGLAGTHFSNDLLEDFIDLSGLVDSLAEEAEEWVSFIRGTGYASVDLPKGWYIVDGRDYDDAIDFIDEYIRWFQELVDDSFY